MEKAQLENLEEGIVYQLNCQYVSVEAQSLDLLEFATSREPYQIAEWCASEIFGGYDVRTGKTGEWTRHAHSLLAGQLFIHPPMVGQLLGKVELLFQPSFQ